VKNGAQRPRKDYKASSVRARTDQAPVTRFPDVRYLFAALTLIAITLAAFSNSFESGFVLDNKGLLLDPRIRALTRGNIGLIFGHAYWWPAGEAGLYRPFTTLSYLFNYALLGDRDQPFGYHTVNLLLHLVNVWLAWLLALRLTRKLWPATLIAALWAVHPILTESVTNIVGRADLLGGMAVLAGFLLYLKARESSGGERGLWFAGLLLVTALGVFSKESAVAILPVIIFYELIRWRESSSHRALWFGCAATLLPIAVMLCARWFVLASSPAAEFPFTDNPITGAGWWAGRFTAIEVMVRYLWLAVWPAKLSCDYSWNQIPLARGALSDWLCCGLMLAIAGAAALLYRSNRLAFFLAGFAFLNFLPASNLLFPIGTIMAERLLYLPLLGITGCLVLVLSPYLRTPAARARGAAILCAVVAMFAVRTWVRNQVWQSELSIASSDVEVNPNSFKLHRLLASSLFEADPSHANIDHVIAEQNRSLELLDPLPPALNRADAYRMAGYYDLIKSRQPGGRSPELYGRAIEVLRRSISIDRAGRSAYQHESASTLSAAASGGGEGQAWLLLSVAYAESGDTRNAPGPAMQALLLDPLNPQVYRQLSAIFFDDGDRAEAEIVNHLEDALHAVDQQDWSRAQDLSARVLAQAPAQYPAAAYVNALANLRLGKPDIAESSAREAIRLDSAHRLAKASYVLACALEERGNFAESARLLIAYLKTEPYAADAETARAELEEVQRSARRAPGTQAGH
jgi:hypothetical protein